MELLLPRCFRRRTGGLLTVNYLASYIIICVHGGRKRLNGDRHHLLTTIGSSLYFQEYLAGESTMVMGLPLSLGYTSQR